MKLLAIIQRFFKRKGNLYCIVVREYGLVYKIFGDKKEAVKVAVSLNAMGETEEYKVYKLVKIS